MYVLVTEQNTDYHVGDIVWYDDDKILSTEGNCLCKFTFENKSDEISFCIDGEKYIFPISEKQYEWIQKLISNYKGDNVCSFETHNNDMYLLALTKIDLNSIDEKIFPEKYGHIVWSESTWIKDKKIWECIFVTDYKTYQVICKEDTIQDNDNKASWCCVRYDSDFGRNKVICIYPKHKYEFPKNGCYCVEFQGQKINPNTRQRRVNVALENGHRYDFTWDTYLKEIKLRKDKIIIWVHDYNTKIFGKWEKGQQDSNCECCKFANTCDCVKRRIIDKLDECKKCDYWKRCNPKSIYRNYDFNEDIDWLS